jgi:hypothetical protein
MQTAIVRHILVKDKTLAEQLKKKFSQGETSLKLLKNTQRVIQQNVAVNWVKSKKGNWCL